MILAGMTATRSDWEKGVEKKLFSPSATPLFTPFLVRVEQRLGIGLVPGDPTAAALAGRSASGSRQAPVRSRTASSETERPGAQHRVCPRSLSAPSMLLCFTTSPLPSSSPRSESQHRTGKERLSRPSPAPRAPAGAWGTEYICFAI